MCRLVRMCYLSICAKYLVSCLMIICGFFVCVLIQVSGVGVQNPYRIRPFLGAKVPVNSSFSPVISMYNPHGTLLQVCFTYSALT